MDEQGRHRRVSDHGFERGYRTNSSGSNELEIKITNQWVNRRVGDRSLDPEMQVLSSGAPRFGAPRAVLLQTGDEDLWSDPKGEFLAAVDAGRVYELLGAEGPGYRSMAGAGRAGSRDYQLLHARRRTRYSTV